MTSKRSETATWARLKQLCIPGWLLICHLETWGSANFIPPLPRFVKIPDRKICSSPYPSPHSRKKRRCCNCQNDVTIDRKWCILTFTPQAVRRPAFFTLVTATVHTGPLASRYKTYRHTKARPSTDRQNKTKGIVNTKLSFVMLFLSLCVCACLWYSEVNVQDLHELILCLIS